MRPRIRDSYYAHVWLDAAMVAFLDSRYPDDELPVQIAKHLKDAMRAQAERRSGAQTSSRVQVLQFLTPETKPPSADGPVLLPTATKPLVEPGRRASKSAGYSPKALRQLAAAAEPESALEPESKKPLNIPAKLIRDISPLDPVSRLMQLGQRAKLASPVFEFEQSVQRDLPWFTCRCRWEHYESAEAAGSKKAAKHAAAAAVWNLIVGET